MIPGWSVLSAALATPGGLIRSGVGTYSRKSSYNGLPGIGDPRFPTISNADDLYLLVTGLRLTSQTGHRNTVLLLDAVRTLEANWGTWPGDWQRMRHVLAAHPEVILVQVTDSNAFHRRVRGVPPGTKVTVVAGAEPILGLGYPAPCTALVVSVGALQPDLLPVIGTAQLMTASGADQASPLPPTRLPTGRNPLRSRPFPR